MPRDALPARVRKCTISDADFCVALAKRLYTKEEVDWGAVEQSAHAILSDDSRRLMVVRTSDAVVLASATDWFYAPGVYTVSVVLFYGSAWGVIACLKEIISWSMAIGAIRVQIDALYQGVNVEPLLKRAGWKFEEGKLFTIPLVN